MQSQRFLIFGFLGFLICATSRAESNYLLSDIKVLRTPEANFSFVYLSPNRYLMTDDYKPTRVGKLLASTAEAMGEQAGAFILKDFRTFYKDDPAALQEINEKIAPSIEQGKLLDGHSNFILVYRSSVPPDGRGARLVGVMGSQWVTEDSPKFAFQGKRTIPWPELKGVGSKEERPGHLQRTESREITHLAIKSGEKEDIAGLMASVATGFGILGERQERHYRKQSPQYLEVTSRPETFYLRAPREPRLIAYYEHRTPFREEKSLSDKRHVVMKFDAKIWSEKEALQGGLLGKSSAASLFALGKIETIEQRNLIVTLDDKLSEGGFPSTRELKKQIANGTFRVTTEREICFRGLVDLGGVPNQSPGFRPSVVNP